MVEKDPQWQPRPFIDVWAGHLLFGILAAVGVYIVLTLSSWVFMPHVGLTPIIVLALVGWLTAETISTLFDRWYAKLKQHHMPGGWIWASSRPVIFAFVYTTAGFALLRQPGGALICGASAAIVAIVETIMIKKWRPGLNTAQAREVMRMKKEQAIRILRKDDGGDTDPNPNPAN